MDPNRVSAFGSSKSHANFRDTAMDEYGAKKLHHSLAAFNTHTTQTEWSWVNDMQIMDRVRKESVELLGDILQDIGVNESEYESEEVEDDNNNNNNDNENGIERTKSKQRTWSTRHRRHTAANATAIGPPKILKYNPERKTSLPLLGSTLDATGANKRKASSNERHQRIANDDGNDDADIIYNEADEDERVYNQVEDYLRDLHIIIRGNQPCGFCSQTTREWISLDIEQQSFCCQDNKDFMQVLIEYQRERENIIKSNLQAKIDDANNQTARRLLKEKLNKQNFQKMLEKQRKPDQPKQGSNKSALKKLITIKEEKKTSATAGDGKSKEAAIPKYFKEPATNSLGAFNSQSRSISYQLSNPKYMKEGWTVRPDTPLRIVDYTTQQQQQQQGLDGTSTSQEFDSPMAKSGFIDYQLTSSKFFERALTMRHYKSGQPSLILFPDGSGNAFYSNGSVAVSVINLIEDAFLTSIFLNDETTGANLSTQLASFDSHGNGFVNFITGKLRLVLNSTGGIEFDANGNRKKQWSWWDTHTCHVPPFQFINITLNEQLSLKIYDQNRITLKFMMEHQMCRFEIGSNLKTSKPETIINYPPYSHAQPQPQNSFKSDAVDVYLKRRKQNIDDLLKKLAEVPHSRLPRLPALSRMSSATSRSATKSSKSMRAPTNFSFTYTGKTSSLLGRAYQKPKATSKFLTVP